MPCHKDKIVEFLESFISEDQKTANQIILDVLRSKMKSKVEEDEDAEKKLITDQPESEDSTDSTDSTDTEDDKELSTSEQIEKAMMTDAVTFDDVKETVFTLAPKQVDDIEDVKIIDAKELAGGKSSYTYADKIESLVFDDSKEEEPVNTFITKVNIKTDDSQEPKVFYVTQLEGAITGIIELKKEEAKKDDKETLKTDDEAEPTDTETDTTTSSDEAPVEEPKK